MEEVDTSEKGGGRLVSLDHEFEREKERGLDLLLEINEAKKGGEK